MKVISSWQFWIAVVLTLILGLMAMTVVNTVYRARTLFVQYDHLDREGTRLKNEHAELLWQVRRASLPSHIYEAGTSMGLEAADDAHTVSLVLTHRKVEPLAVEAPSPDEVPKSLPQESSAEERTP